MRHSDGSQLVLLCLVSILTGFAMCEVKQSFTDFLDLATPLAKSQKLTDDDGKDLARKVHYLGTVPEVDWKGVIQPRMNKYNDNFRVDDADEGSNQFRTLTPGKTRGSSKNLHDPVKPLDHKPQENAPKGCGNPVCIIIDKKPRRFPSMCAVRAFMEDNARCEQINFVQKGDCYQIIDQRKSGGARKSPWSTDVKQDAGCSACKKDQLCNGKVTVIIDIENILKGYSSAPGSEKYEELTDKQRENRMPGLPFEFDCICELMQFMETKENLNIKTQVMGIAFSEVKTIFNPAGDNCLWTEWFDHDTPCNSELDKETHSEHLEYLQSSLTGAYRICHLQEIKQTQHEGGSEITQITHIQAANGEGKGKDGAKLQQKITYAKDYIKCVEKEQEHNKPYKLPAPFIYGERNEKNESIYTKCLDYKSRYCCGANVMWRPQSIEAFQSRLPFTLPMGVSITEVLRDSNGHLKETQTRVYTNNDVKKFFNIKISYMPKKKNDEKTPITGTLKCEGDTRSFKGFYRITKDYPDGSKEITITINNEIPANVAMGYIKIALHHHVGVKWALYTEVKEIKQKLISTSTIQQPGYQMKKGEGYQSYKPGKKGDTSWIIGDGKQYEIEFKVITIITDFEQGKKTMEAHVNVMGDIKPQIVNIEGTLKVNIDNSDQDIWKQLVQLQQTYGLSLVVDSPPIENLFHECEWRDWVSIDYPNKGQFNQGEYELRAHTDGSMKHHVCGVVDEAAHYVDAVTRENQEPWHELEMGPDKQGNMFPYETFKLTPYFGYACKDSNGLGDFCQDMKLRYCCIKNDRATWGKWQNWSSCTKTCGGGKKMRKRVCLTKEKSRKGYNSLCHGQELHLSQETRDRAQKEETDCSLQACPEDHKFKPWSVWTRCTVSCGDGTKTSTRNCKPAKQGGKACPDRFKQPELYIKTEQCTQADCETYMPSLWTSWSPCSVTCGAGSMKRVRHCISQNSLKKVDNINCGNDPDFLEQESKCKLQDCPVDGMWASWSAWSACSQSCVHHPDSERANDIKTKAIRTRERYCSNPMPRFNGKNCARKDQGEGKGYKYIAKTHSERLEGPCITELTTTNEMNSHDQIVPWCPEHCIYSEWGQWGRCSQTCFPMKIKHQTKTKQIETTRYATGIMYDVSSAAHTTPTRRRIRVLKKEARFNGECHEKTLYHNTPGSDNGTIIIQDDECIICKEHCPPNSANSFKPIPYPGENPKCIGYCPVDCEVGESPGNCEDALKDYYKNDLPRKRDQYSKEPYRVNIVDGDCFLSEAYALIADEKGFESLGDQMEKFITKFAQAKDAKIFDKKQDLPFQKPAKFPTKKWRDVEWKWSDDQSKLRDIVLQTNRYRVKGPAYEGLAGGKDCINEGENAKITSDQKKVEQDGYTELLSWEKTEAQCPIQICKLTYKPPGGAFTPQKCTHFRWAEWGKWNPCERSKCGEVAIKERTRICVETCDEKTKVPDNKCPPYVDMFNKNRTWTNTMSTICDPCPPEKTVGWGLWGQWSVYGWSREEACKRGIKFFEHKRERQCTGPGGVKKGCPPGISGKTEGVDVEIAKYPLPAEMCKGGYPNSPDPNTPTTLPPPGPPPDSTPNPAATSVPQSEPPAPHTTPYPEYPEDWDDLVGQLTEEPAPESKRLRRQRRRRHRRLRMF